VTARVVVEVYRRHRISETGMTKPQSRTGLEVMQRLNTHQPVAATQERPYRFITEDMMIELTEEQVRALSEPHSKPPQLLNPRTNEAFVLLRVDEYKQLTAAVYDDSPWTRDELQAAAWATGERSGWDAEADDAPEPR
jgi:hypothetical protein